MGTIPLDLINADDVGIVAGEVLRQGGPFLNKTLHLCGDKLNTYDICKRLSEALAPRIFLDKQVSQ